MNERNFHQFYRMLAPARAIEEHKDCKGEPQHEIDKVIKENMTTPDGNCLLFPQVGLTDCLILFSSLTLVRTVFFAALTLPIVLSGVCLHRLSPLLVQNGKQMMGLAPEKRAMCRLGDTVETWDATGKVWKVQPQTFEDFTYLNGGTGRNSKASLLLYACVRASMCSLPSTGQA